VVFDPSANQIFCLLTVVLKVLPHSEPFLGMGTGSSSVKGQTVIYHSYFGKWNGGFRPTMLSKDYAQPRKDAFTLTTAESH
jgi:hypothetical protein